MDLEEIKNLIKMDKGKFIIVENGQPILVVMSFEDYQKLIGNPARKKEEKEEKKENEQFNSESESQYSQEVEQGEEALNIEDLPV